MWFVSCVRSNPSIIGGERSNNIVVTLAQARMMLLMVIVVICVVWLIADWVALEPKITLLLAIEALMGKLKGKSE